MHRARSWRSCSPCSDPGNYTIAVGVNGSSDRTAEIARKFPVLVAETDVRGYGHGCMAAIEALRVQSPSVAAYVFFAADGASDPRDVRALVGAFEHGYDFVLGARTAMRSNWRTMTFPHVIANVALGLWCTLLTARRSIDLGPLRLIERRLFEAMKLRELTYGWTIEAQIAAARLGARICQLPARERARIAGVQKVSGVSWRRTFAIGCRIVAAGWRTQKRFAHPEDENLPECSPDLVPAHARGYMMVMKLPQSFSSGAKRLACVVGAVVLLNACAGKPPLPKYASVEEAARGSSTENFAALVPDADVVYFPVESASHGGRSDPAARLLEALRQTNAPLAIAWDLVSVSQQPILDELQAAQGSRREELIAQLDLEGTGRAREFCRSLLRAPERASLRHVALGAAPATLAKMRAGGSLEGDEQAQLPRGFRTPPNDYEAFTERLASIRSATGDVSALYRAHLFAEQYAADKIAQHFASNAGGKLLVFLRQSDLEPGRGVPFFVAQRVQLRQLVLGSDRLANRRGKLLTDGGVGSGGGSLEVVDRAPGAGRE